MAVQRLARAESGPGLEADLSPLPPVARTWGLSTVTIRPPRVTSAGSVPWCTARRPALWRRSSPATSVASTASN